MGVLSQSKRLVLYVEQKVNIKKYLNHDLIFISLIFENLLKWNIILIELMCIH